MGFNNAAERRKFEQRWAILRKKYRKAGMSKEVIQSMYEYDCDTFLSDRRYREHTQPLPSECIGDSDEDSMSGLFKKFDSLKVTFGEEDFSGRYSWIETLEDENLSRKLFALSIDDLELITRIVIDEFSQADIARLDGCVRNTVNKKLARIKKVFLEG